MEKFIHSVENENLHIKCIEFVSKYEDIPWDSEDEQKKYDTLSEAASKSNDVVFDDFYAYEEE